MSVNNCVFMGRLTRDPETSQSKTGVVVTTFCIAVGRSGGKEADFIDCVAWEKRALFICRYFKKGDMIAVTGEMRCRTYTDKQDQRRKVVECLVSSVSFTGSLKGDSAGRRLILRNCPTVKTCRFRRRLSIQKL